MSQVENTRIRTAQVVRPQAFNGQPGGRGAGPPGQSRAPDPAYPAGGVDPGYGYWEGTGQQCDCGQCGCGTMYGGPGHGFCWYCMKAMLVKEIECLLKTDPDLQAILNAPRMGVTDGSNALPGQVGEFLSGQAVYQVPALGAGISWSGIGGPITLPAGDWMCSAYGYTGVPYEGVFIGMVTMPPGLSTDMAGGLSLTAGAVGTVVNGVPARALVTTPTLLPFTLSVLGAPSAASVAGPFTIQVEAWRMR
jgi:hypothetical protein